jgi:hypothetical protein
MKNPPATHPADRGNCVTHSACNADYGQREGCAACRNPRTRGLSRRAFLKIALAAGGLTGCTRAIPRSPAPGASATPESTATPTPLPQWRKVRELTAPKWMKFAAFHDEDFGVLLLTENEVWNTSDIRVTTDGGRTLTAGSTQDTYCRFGVEIVDRKVLWNCGRGTVSGREAGPPPATGWKHAVSRSTDGGRSWVNATPLDGEGFLHFTGASNRGAGWACHASFPDAQTGWVASSHPQLAATSDGGASWVPFSLPDGLANIAAIHCLDGMTGCLLDFEGNFHQTGEAGASWTSRALIHADGQSMIPMVNAPLRVAAIRFTDSRHGLVAASLWGGGSSRMVIRRTADGGLSWTTESIPGLMGLPYISRDGNFLTAVDFIKGNKITLWTFA